MDVNNPTHFRGSWRAYAATLGACAVIIGLAGLAFQIDADVVAPAHAGDKGGEHPVSLLRSLRLSALAPGRPIKDSNPPAGHAHGSQPAGVPQVVVISRAPEDGRTGAVEPVEAASPDIDEWTSTERWTPDRDDTFRTVCVRLCDGAFFPVSFATTRDRFKADAARCKAGCGSPARLFVGPPDGALEGLADVKGNAYGALPNAFKFQTSYDAACTCKGQPWETAERARHQGLAEAAKIEALNPVAPVVVVVNPPMTETQSSRVVEIAALRPSRDVRQVTPVEPVRLPPPKAQSVAVTGPVTAALAHVEPNERKKPQRKAVRVATAKPGKTTVQKFTNPFQMVFGPLVKPVKGEPAKVADTSMQRPFKPKEYWRLSYWEVMN